MSANEMISCEFRGDGFHVTAFRHDGRVVASCFRICGMDANTKEWIFEVDGGKIEFVNEQELVDFTRNTILPCIIHKINRQLAECPGSIAIRADICDMAIGREQPNLHGCIVSIGLFVMLSLSAFLGWADVMAHAQVSGVDSIASGIQKTKQSLEVCDAVVSRLITCRNLDNYEFGGQPVGSKDIEMEARNWVAEYFSEVPPSCKYYPNAPNMYSTRARDFWMEATQVIADLRGQLFYAYCQCKTLGISVRPLEKIAAAYNQLIKRQEWCELDIPHRVKYDAKREALGYSMQRIINAVGMVYDRILSEKQKVYVLYREKNKERIEMILQTRELAQKAEKAERMAEEAQSRAAYAEFAAQEAEARAMRAERAAADANAEARRVRWENCR